MRRCATVRDRIGVQGLGAGGAGPWAPALREQTGLGHAQGQPAMLTAAFEALGALKLTGFASQ